jgi:hypothetical protein
VFQGIDKQKVASCSSSQPTSKRDPERGSGIVKAVIWTFILACAAFVAFRIIPAYFSNYQLSDKMQEQAKFAVVKGYSEEQIRENVFKMVEELEIPAKREDIKVAASLRGVKISVDYTVPVDLVVYQMDLHFTPSSENKSLI